MLIGDKTENTKRHALTVNLDSADIKSQTPTLLHLINAASN